MSKTIGQLTSTYKSPVKQSIPLTFLNSLPHARICHLGISWRRLDIACEVADQWAFHAKIEDTYPNRGSHATSKFLRSNMLEDEVRTTKTIVAKAPDLRLRQVWNRHAQECSVTRVVEGCVTWHQEVKLINRSINGSMKQTLCLLTRGNGTRLRPSFLKSLEIDVRTNPM